MMSRVAGGDLVMGRIPQSAIRVLLVEPDLSLKVAVLDAARASEGRLEVACVSTCGGAGLALDRERFDALLLSTNLTHYREELADLPALMQFASKRGLPILTISPPGIRQRARGFEMPVHESLDFEALAFGNLERVVRRALSRHLATAARDPSAAPEPQLH